MSNENGIRETARIRGEDDVFFFASPGGDRFVEVSCLPDNENAWERVRSHVEDGKLTKHGRGYPLTVNKRYLSSMSLARNEEIEFNRVRS